MGYLTQRGYAVLGGGEGEPPPAGEAGASVGPYTAAAYWVTEPILGEAPELSPGNTVILLFELLDTWSGDRCPAGCVSGGGGDGWWLDCYVAGGEHRLMIVFPPAGFYLTESRLYPYGLNCVVITRTAGGSLRVSCNGEPAAEVEASPTYTAVGGSGQLTLGRAPPGSGGDYALTNGRIFAFGHIEAEANDTELQDWSGAINTLSRKTPHVGVTDHVDLLSLLDFSQGDWDGVAGEAVASQGSAPQTFIRIGSLLLVQGVAEVQIETEEGWWQDNGQWTEQTIGAVTYREKSEYCSCEIETDAAYLVVDVVATYPFIFDQRTLQVYLDDVHLFTAPVFETGVSRALDLPIGAGGGTVRIVEGLKATVGDYDEPDGEYVLAIRYPQGSTTSVSTPVAPVNRAVGLGDSIMSGDTADDQFAINGYVNQVRETWAGRFTAVAFGARALAYDYANPTRTARLKAEMIQGASDATGSVQFVLNIGTNDYTFNSCNPTQFEGYYGDLLDALITAYPACRIYCISLLVQGNEGTPNGGGWTQANYRTATSNAATARPGNCVYVDGLPILNPATELADNVHPNQAGHDVLGPYVRGLLEAP